MINLATLNAERKARIGAMWISVPLNDREPYRFRSTLPADAKGWMDGLGLADDEQGGLETIIALVDPAQRDQFKADCADVSVEYGIDSVTMSRVNQFLTEIYAGKGHTEPSSPSSASPANTSTS